MSLEVSSELEEPVLSTRLRVKTRTDSVLLQMYSTAVYTISNFTPVNLTHFENPRLLNKFEETDNPWTNWE